MRIAFRVDSSKLIGAGHIKRCLKLAEELKFKCEKIIFITKNLNGNFNYLIKKKKFKFVSIKRNEFKNKLNKDLDATKSICKRFKINTLIIDHYYLGLSWEKKIRKHIKKLVVIDDFSKRKHHCDLIINNIGKKNTNNTKYLTGLEYVITPNNFSHKKNKKISKIQTIGTFFGSTDNKNCSEEFLKIVSQKEFNDFKFICILGKNNKNKKKIEKKNKKFKNFNIEKKFVDMKTFLKKINILITSGGVTSFEALSSGIKCINIPINFYQKMNSNFQKRRGVSEVLNYSKVFSKNGKQLLIDCFKKITKESNFLGKKISIDGRGSRKIANYILGKEFNRSTKVN